MKNLIGIAMVSSLLCGCVHTYEISKHRQNLNLKRDGSAYVAVPADGRYGDILYHGSGATTAQMVAGAFAKHLNRIHVADNAESFDTAFESSKKGNFDYLILPQIFHWEDRATEWSGLPDRIEVKIQIVDTVNSSTLDSVIIKGKSRWATFGGDHPPDLLPKPLNHYVDSLFGETKKTRSIIER
jgi:hypothetical protein